MPGRGDIGGGGSVKVDLEDTSSTPPGKSGAQVGPHQGGPIRLTFHWPDGTPDKVITLTPAQKVTFDWP